MLVPFEELLGKTISEVENEGDGESLMIYCSDGSGYRMYHQQDYSEHVYLESGIDELRRLIGSPITRAEVSCTDAKNDDEEYPAVAQWTFYKLGTFLGSATLRWYGESNEYYSVEVSFCRVVNPNPKLVKPESSPYFRFV